MENYSNKLKFTKSDAIFFEDNLSYGDRATVVDAQLETYEKKFNDNLNKNFFHDHKNILLIRNS